MKKSSIVTVWIMTFMFLCSCGKQDNSQIGKLTNHDGISMSEQNSTIEVFGNKWTFQGRYMGHLRLFDMEGGIYVCKDEGIRLITLKRLNNSTNIKDRVIFTQKSIGNDKWVNDGPYEEWFVDGRYCISHYKQGAEHGEFKEWYPNGQLHVQETYVDGKLNGLSVGWYENGKKQYESEYINDVEFSRIFYREDGTIQEKSITKKQ